MTQLFDIRTSILFQEGREEGRQKGHEEGREEGHEEGREEGHIEGLDQGDHKRQLIVIANMITKTSLGLAQIADLSEVEEAFVIEVKEKLEKEIWAYPETWTDEEWITYFIEKENEEGDSEE